MQRIHDPTAVVSLPAPPALSGPIGFFTGGSPGVTPATLARYWWFNMIQEEIMSVLASAGVTPDTTGLTNNQLLASLKKLSAAAARSQLFTASGNFTTDAFTSLVWLTGAAGGGAGGGAIVISGGSLFAGGGGGAGDWCWRMPVAVVPSTTYAVTIAGLSTGGTVSTTPGGTAGTGASGGVTSFGALVSLAGGLGGVGGNLTPGSPGVGGAGGFSGGTGTLTGSPGLVGYGMSTPAVTNGSMPGGRGGVSMFAKFGRGGDGGDAGYSSGTTPSPLPGQTGAGGILQVEW